MESLTILCHVPPNVQHVSESCDKVKIGGKLLTVVATKMISKFAMLVVLLVAFVLSQDYYFENEHVLYDRDDPYENDPHRTYARGHKHANSCPEEKDGALCYPWCRDGYKGVGPVCWERVCIAS